MDNSFLHTKRLLLVDDEQELLKMVSDMQSIEYMVQCILNEKKEKRQIEIDKLQKKTDEHFDKIADIIKMQ